MILEEISKEKTIAISVKQTMSFGIKDDFVLYDILCNKLYTDPIAAICREVVTNLRDANQEVGKPNVPVVKKRVLKQKINKNKNISINYLEYYDISINDLYP